MARSIRSPFSQHFSRVAASYNELRMTDPEPVDLMVRALAGLSAVTAADVGCGTGRYMVELMRRLGENLFVYFIDRSEGMLEHLRLDPRLLGITGFRRSPSSGGADCPFPTQALTLCSPSMPSIISM